MWTVRLPLNGPWIVLWYNFPVCVLITSWYKMLMKNPIILNNLRKLYTYWNHLVNFWAFLLTRKLIFGVIDSVFFFQNSLNKAESLIIWKPVISFHSSFFRTKKYLSSQLSKTNWIFDCIDFMSRSFLIKLKHYKKNSWP